MSGTNEDEKTSFQNEFEGDLSNQKDTGLKSKIFIKLAIGAGAFLLVAVVASVSIYFSGNLKTMSYGPTGYTPVSSSSATPSALPTLNPSGPLYPPPASSFDSDNDWGNFSPILANTSTVLIPACTTPPSSSTPYPTSSPSAPYTGPIATPYPTSSPSPIMRPFSMGNTLKPALNLFSTKKADAANPTTSVCMNTKSNKPVGSFITDDSLLWENAVETVTPSTSLTNARAIWIAYCDGFAAPAPDDPARTAHGQVFNPAILSNAFDYVGFFRETNPGKYSITSGQAKECNTTSYQTIAKGYYLTAPEPSCTVPAASTSTVLTKGKIKIMDLTATQKNILRNAFQSQGRSDIYNSILKRISYSKMHELKHTNVYYDYLECFNNLDVNTVTLQNTATPDLAFSDAISLGIEKCKSQAEKANQDYDAQEAKSDPANRYFGDNLLLHCKACNVLHSGICSGVNYNASTHFDAN